MRVSANSIISSDPARRAIPSRILAGTDEGTEQYSAQAECAVRSAGVRRAQCVVRSAGVRSARCWCARGASGAEGAGAQGGAGVAEAAAGEAGDLAHTAHAAAD